MAGGSSHHGSEADNLKATELRLGLPGIDVPDQPSRMAHRGSKRALAEPDEECSETGSAKSSVVASPAAKAQVVGWPPIRSYRRSSIRAWKAEAEAVGIYVKVSMDGAPYLRKIDLKVYNGYEELRKALEGMFKCFSLGELSGIDGCEYAITYEDKDGDLMLVGDVPWEMFISSCKRLRIMRGSEARGLGSTL